MTSEMQVKRRSREKQKITEWGNKEETENRL